jgi:hypothetical protein
MLKFIRKVDGLVTIEWVGIAAVMVLAAIAITGFVMQGADTAGGSVNEGLNTVATAAKGVVAPGAFGTGGN